MKIDVAELNFTLIYLNFDAASDKMKIESSIGNKSKEFASL